MLVNLKLKKILPLAAACLLVASGAYAVGPEDPDHREGVSRRKASDLALDDQSSKRQKLPEDFSDLDELPRGIWGPISNYLSASDLLNLRLANKIINLILLDLWKQKVSQANPHIKHINFSQAWADGPAPRSFGNFGLNLVIHRIQMELVTYLPVVFTHRRLQETTLNDNMTKLRGITNYYPALTPIFECFDGIKLRLLYLKQINKFLSEDRVSSLTNKGDAEKRLAQYFHFLYGVSFDRNSQLYVAPKPGEPKSIAELISDELALRERIQQAPKADRLALYEELWANGIYMTVDDYRNAASAYFEAEQYEQAARYYEVVLGCPDATTQDFRCAAITSCHANQYEQAARYHEVILGRPDAAAQDFRNAGITSRIDEQFEQEARCYEGVLGRFDATTDDFRCAGSARFNAKHYAQAAAHYEAVLRRSDYTEEDHRRLRELRLKIQEQG